MSDKPITEAQLLKMEGELEKMGWTREDCGYWLDPITGRHEPATIGYKIALQRIDKIALQKIGYKKREKNKGWMTIVRFEKHEGVVSEIVGEEIQVVYESLDADGNPLKQVYRKNQFTEPLQEGDRIIAQVFLSKVNE
jgi:hypothetical protein